MKRELYKLILVAIMIVFAFSLGFFLGREVTLAGPRMEQAQTPAKLPAKKKGAYQKNPLQHTLPANPSNPRLSNQNLSDLNPSAQTQREKVLQYKKNWLNREEQKADSAIAGRAESSHQAQKQPQSENKIPTEILSPGQNKKPKGDSTAEEDIQVTPLGTGQTASGLLPKQPPLTTPLGTGQEAIKQQATPVPPPAEDLKAKGPKNQPEVQKKQEKSANKVYVLQIKSHKNRENAMKQSTDLKLRFPRWRFFFKKTGESYTVYIGPFKFKQSAQRILRKLKNKKEFASTRIKEL